MAVLEGSIGGITFLRLSGEVNPQGDEPETFVAPGVDGLGADNIGERSREFVMISTVDVADDVDKLALLSNYKALQSTLVTVIDSTGDTFDNVLVIHVEPVQSNSVIGGVGGKNADPAGLFSCRWEMQATEALE